jgi:hypothetical protein
MKRKHCTNCTASNGGEPTKHKAVRNADDQPVWECLLCWHQSPRRVQARKRTELDELFDALVQE